MLTMLTNSTETCESRSRSVAVGPNRHRAQLQRLLREIEETAQQRGRIDGVEHDVKRLRHFAQGLDEVGAEMMIAAIRLGEEFASLYFGDLADHPPHACPAEPSLVLPWTQGDPG